MKKIIPFMLFLCFSLFTTCEEEKEDPAFTCEVNGEKWESVTTKCDLYIEQGCKERQMKLIATALGGKQFEFSIYNYQDTVCEEIIGSLDYFIDNNNNNCEKSDTTVLCREVVTYYRTNSGVKYYSRDDAGDKITITSCDSKNKTISGNFNIHFYNTEDGALVYEVINGKFEDIYYYIHYY